MDPAVASLDFSQAGAIIANMSESYLAAGAPPLNAEGADHHAESEDCRSSSDVKSPHLHSSVDDGASTIQEPPRIGRSSTVRNIARSSAKSAPQFAEHSSITRFKPVSSFLPQPLEEQRRNRRCFAIAAGMKHHRLLARPRPAAVRAARSRSARPAVQAWPARADARNCRRARSRPSAGRCALGLLLAKYMHTPQQNQVCTESYEYPTRKHKIIKTWHYTFSKITASPQQKQALIRPPPTAQKCRRWARIRPRRSAGRKPR
jgi:hypothetical protein